MSFRRPTSRWLTLGAAVVAALSLAHPAFADDVDDPPTSEIVGGTVSATCNWPSVAFLGDCTAALIHPRVLVTAAHCAPKAGDRVTFGERTPWAFTVLATKCVSGEPSGNKDWAYCVMPDDARLRSMPIVPPIHGCEKSRYMTLGATAVAVGFGQVALQNPAAGVKRSVEVAFTNLNSALYFDVDGDALHGLCHGDSGGPLFLHIVDGATDYGWRTIGTVTGLVGTGTDCAGNTRYMSLDQHILAIEMNEGIDVTPCTDMLGKWNPGPNCRAFPTDPGQAGGTWPNCSVGPVSGSIDTCGAAFGSGGSGAGGATGAATTGTGGLGGTGLTDGGRSGSAGAGGSGGGQVGPVTGASVGTTGPGGASQAATADGTGGTGEQNASETGASSSSGCNCRVGSGRRDQRMFFASLALFALTLVARRRPVRTRG